MSSYCIVTDATADLPQSLVEEKRISVIPMECTLGPQTYVYEPTGRELQLDFFYNKMREGISTGTSQINVFAYVSFFAPILERGDDILYIAFSSALTGSQQSCHIAIEELRQKYPACRILCVDSLAASLGEGLLVYYAAEQKEKGLSLDALADWVVNNRNHLSHWFTVDDLSYLARGGRLSAASAFLGTALRIKPVLHVDDLGRLTPLEKVQGRKRSLKGLVEQMKSTYQPQPEDMIFIGHADALQDAEYVRDLIKETFGVKNFLIDYIGPIIGAHSGPGTVALFHYGSHK